MVGFTAQQQCGVGAHNHFRITGGICVAVHSGNNSKSRKCVKLLTLNRCRDFALRSCVGNERTLLRLLVY